jgi:hypothetical protein
MGMHVIVVPGIFLHSAACHVGVHCIDVHGVDVAGLDVRKIGLFLIVKKK